jgi:predicted enzyme related to lactoylglutathione lyase
MAWLFFLGLDPQPITRIEVGQISYLNSMRMLNFLTAGPSQIDDLKPELQRYDREDCLAIVDFFSVVARCGAAKNHKETKLKVTEIAFTGTPVTDIERARAFYEGVLELKPRMESLGGPLVGYRIGNGIFTVAYLGEPWKPSADGTFIAFEVADLDAEIVVLESKGVKFAMKGTDLPTAPFSMIFGPDGNKIMIHAAMR